MLRHRLVTVLTFNDGTLFRTKLFQPDYRYTHNFVDSWQVDEIVMLDVTRKSGDNQAFLEVVGKFARECFVPLAVGGGIRALADVRRFMAVGGDKVVVNSGAVERPGLITEIAEAYGAQCVVLSIDARKMPSGGYEVFTGCGSKATGLEPAAWAKRAEGLGAGEVLITSIERDGSLQGYDLELCKRVSDAVSVPVLVLGGAGSWKHFGDGIEKGGASAVCTQNIYHFTESSILSAKKFLADRGIAVRM
ncbi:MAG: imidazole glycerol phosphate synthase subunit HisF [Rhodospirillales bacterium]|nr:imidazole glycerol phosphate synthase subunit HisF [Rhodospirillales bacterium]